MNDLIPICTTVKERDKRNLQQIRHKNIEHATLALGSLVMAQSMWEFFDHLFTPQTDVDMPTATNETTDAFPNGIRVGCTECDSFKALQDVSNHLNQEEEMRECVPTELPDHRATRGHTKKEFFKVEHLQSRSRRRHHVFCGLPNCVHNLEECGGIETYFSTPQNNSRFFITNQ